MDTPQMVYTVSPQNPGSDVVAETAAALAAAAIAFSNFDNPCSQKKSDYKSIETLKPLMPYLRRINEGVNKIYASKTLLLLQEDGTLKPLTIELSLPHPEGDNFGPISNVYTPAQEGLEDSVWQLSRHAVVEPFVIAANRQLSVLHPIYKLLYPLFCDIMNINALARQILINGGGILEKTVFPGKYSKELSFVLYKDWVFPQQALPAELVKRVMTVVDSNSHHGIHLLIEDYPYAVDGLEILSALESWVEDYCKFYYTNDDIVRNDVELQSWWKELQEVGHVASALHAAVNYGQYPYVGFLPNRLTLSRRFMPEPNTPEYDELEQNPENVFLKTITPQLQTLLGISLIELLSKHPSYEVYLGQIECPEWTLDVEPLKAFEKFGN
ncbi:probable linoleate 9S-lipoxygenase 5 [Tanacetum coccineum]